MADEGDNLHDPWAPPPDGTTGDRDHRTGRPDAGHPARAVLDDLTTPLPPFEPVTIPTRTGTALSRRKWPGAAKPS
jgi:hypothetical protein